MQGFACQGENFYFSMVKDEMVLDEDKPGLASRGCD